MRGSISSRSILATRRARTLDALEGIAAEPEKLRILREHEPGARVVDEEGALCVGPAQEEYA